MLSKDLNWDAIRKDFAQRGYTRIENALEPSCATRVAEAIIRETEWELCYLSGDGPVFITHAELQDYTPERSARLNNDIFTRARSDFSYFYYRSALAGNNNPRLIEFHDFLRGGNFLGFARYLTDDLTIHTINGQLTCYRPACFLRRHNDTTTKEHRIAAYVFGFTPQWEADWGGLLHIQDEKFNIIDTHKPAFNTLTIFRVPTWHFVSQVANYAQGARYTVTGWILAP